jgi:hypothetical protein
MSEEATKRLYAVEKQLHAALAEGKLTLGLYFKGLMQVAYEYAVEGLVQEALQTALKIDVNYLRHESVTQMQMDADYHHQVDFLYRTLLVSGLIPDAFTQKKAEA